MILYTPILSGTDALCKKLHISLKAVEHFSVWDLQINKTSQQYLYTNTPFYQSL